MEAKSVARGLRRDVPGADTRLRHLTEPPAGQSGGEVQDEWTGGPVVRPAGGRVDSYVGNDEFMWLVVYIMFLTIADQCFALWVCCQPGKCSPP